MILNLTYPESLEGQEFLTETEPKVLKRLIENDGTLDLNSDIKRITQLLHDINRCPKSLSKAEDLLKLFHAKYSSLSQAIRDYSIDNLKERASSDELMHELTREMAFASKAYLSLLSENKKWVFGLPKKSAFGVNYSLHYLTLLKTELYSLDRALPSYLWQEIFHLYQYAEHHKLTLLKVKKTNDRATSMAPTVKDSFVRAVLLASMEPYELERREIWNLFHKLGGSLDGVQISDDVTEIKESHCFGFNYKFSERPKLLKEQNNHDQDSRYINIDSFAAKIKEELKRFNSNQPQVYPFLSANNSRLQEKLLQTMYKYSVQYISRASDRYPIDVEVKALWGFQDILHLLKSDIDLSAFPEDGAYRKFANNVETNQDIIWQMVNESQGGACVKQEQSTDLRIAETTPVLLSKKLPNQEGAWKFAISRWNKVSNVQCKVGLKYLKGNLKLATNSNDPSQEFVFIGPDEKNRSFLLAPENSLDGAKNFVISVNEQKLLVCKKAALAFSDSNLVQIEVIKKSS